MRNNEKKIFNDEYTVYFNQLNKELEIFKGITSTNANIFIKLCFNNKYYIFKE